MIPPEAVAAAAEVLGTTTLDDRPVGTGDGDADAVVAGLMLEAAAPLIAAPYAEREQNLRAALARFEHAESAAAAKTAGLAVAAERERIREAALAEVARYDDFGCAALVRRALQRFADLLEGGQP